MQLQKRKNKFYKLEAILYWEHGMRWWLLAVKFSMEKGVSWKKGWTVGGDGIGYSIQVRVLVSEQREAFDLAYVHEHPFKFQQQMAACPWSSTRKGLGPMQADSGSPLGQHGAEDLGVVFGVTYCISTAHNVCSKREVFPQNQCWFLSLCSSPKDVSGASAWHSYEGHRDDGASGWDLRDTQ